MNQAEARKAVDEAAADGIKRLFGVLAQAFMADGSHADALERFEKGLAVHDQAHASAAAAVERIFPE